MSRPWVLLVAAIGVVALLWGGATLQGIFRDERDAAQAAIATRERALAQYALVALDRKLRRQLEDARPRIEAALADPLQPDDGLLFVEDGMQRLPRILTHAPGDDAPARRLQERLLATALPPGDGLWGERLALLGELRLSLESANAGAITKAVHDLLNHESRYVLPATQELPLRLAYVQLLESRTSPDRRLLEALLRDGLRGTRGRRLAGAQTMLLSNAERFTRPDFDQLARAISELSSRARVVHDDFDASVRRAASEPIAVPESLEAPALVGSGAWYAAPIEKTALSGVSVQLDELLAEVTAEMRAGGLFGAGAGVGVASAPPAVTPTTELPVRVQSPELSLEAAQIDERYGLKSAITVALGVLVAGVAALSSLLYRRERRYLESKAAFVATVSHELRTPIASLRLMGETLERRLAGSDIGKDFPTRIVAEADRLAFLVENVLSFNRLERAQVTTNRQPVTLEEIVDAVRPEIAAFTKKAVELQLEGGSEILSVDFELVRLLLSNLVHNACKYNDHDPVTIAVAARSTPGHTVMTVTDDGRGIPRDDWESVFTEFVRSRSGAGSQGFGLGLALCRRIMSLHGGTIRIAQSDDTGTTFEMTFPDGGRTS